MCVFSCANYSNKFKKCIRNYIRTVKEIIIIEIRIMLSGFDFMCKEVKNPVVKV